MSDFIIEFYSEEMPASFLEMQFKYQKFNKGEVAKENILINKESYLLPKE